MVELLIKLWLAWCVANVILFALGVKFGKHDHPYFNGFTVFVPWDWALALSKRELEMVVMHELGHKAHWHVWKNLLRLLFCFPARKITRVKQELQADDFVTDPGSLASALRKMSVNPFDLYRADRLDARAQTLARGMRVDHL